MRVGPAGRPPTRSGCQLLDVELVRTVNFDDYDYVLLFDDYYYDCQLLDIELVRTVNFDDFDYD